MLVEMREPRRLPPARPDDRRRRRRGVRQGRPLPRARLPGRAGDRPRWPCDGDPEAIAFPRAMLQRRPRLQLQRAEDVGDEPRPQEPRRRRPRTSPPRSRRPSSTCSSRSRAARRSGGREGSRARRRRRRQLAAARAFLGACADDGLPASCPSRAMCTDNAAMIAAAGWYRLKLVGPSGLDEGASPTCASSLESACSRRAHRRTASSVRHTG